MPDTNARSGNPAKKAAAKKTAAKKAPRAGVVTKGAQKAVDDVSAFKKRSKGISLPLPSGLVCEAKRVELRTFIQQGSVPNPLMSVVSEALEKGKEADIPSMVGVDKGEIDLEMVNEMYEMVNKVVIASVIAPQVNPVPEDENDRDDDLLYVDEVDDEDKLFIFQWASGGTSDIEKFRLEAGTDMDALAKGQVPGAATQ